MKGKNQSDVKLHDITKGQKSEAKPEDDDH